MNNTLAFGKHGASTYEHMRTHNIAYCNWVLKQKPMIRAMIQFREHLLLYSSRIACEDCNGSGLGHGAMAYSDAAVGDDTVIGFGKHQGRSYKDILCTDIAYCNWILKTKSRGQMLSFQQYLVQHSVPVSCESCNGTGQSDIMAPLANESKPESLVTRSGSEI